MTDAEPWKLKGTEESRRVQILRTTLEAIYALAHFLAPIIPNAAQAIFNKLSTEPVPTNQLRGDFYNLRPGTKVTLGGILFEKIIDKVSDESGAPIEASAPAAGKAAKIKLEKKTTVELNPDQSDFSKIELRVGRIKNVWNHESADR